MGGETFTVYRIPLSAILLWPKANYVNPVHRTWAAPFSLALLAITSLVVLGRLFARVAGLAGTFGLDDALIFVAWLSGAAFTGLETYTIWQTGTGRHIWDVPSTVAVSGALVGWLCWLFYIWASCLTKVSILLFYRRMVRRAYSRYIQWFIYAAILITVLYQIGYTIYLFLICRPFTAYWTSLDFMHPKPYKCGDPAALHRSIPIISVISDAYALAIPVLVIYGLELHPRQKMVLYAVFCCGFLVIGAGIARTVYMFRMFSSPTRDFTWIGFDIIVWGEIELQLAIICASVPALKGFFSQYFRDRISFSSAHHSGNKKSTGTSASDTFDGFQLTTTSAKAVPLAESNGRREASKARDGDDLELLETKSAIGNRSIWITEGYSVEHGDASSYDRSIP